jgi:hypothetical protein
MKKIIAALVTASVIAVASIGASTTAEAHGPGPGFGIAAGILGGLVVGSAIASQNRYYNDDYVVVRHPVYEDEVVCHRVQFVDDYGRSYWRRVCH